MEKVMATADTKKLFKILNMLHRFQVLKHVYSRAVREDNAEMTMVKLSNIEIKGTFTW